MDGAIRWLRFGLYGLGGRGRLPLPGHVGTPALPPESNRQQQHEEIFVLVLAGGRDDGNVAGASHTSTKDSTMCLILSN